MLCNKRKRKDEKAADRRVSPRKQRNAAEPEPEVRSVRRSTKDARRPSKSERQRSRSANRTKPLKNIDSVRLSTRPRRSTSLKTCEEAKVADSSSLECTSDGVSFEGHSDDDVLPDINMESPSKEKGYSEDDIIWAPFKDVYWPAIVTSVQLPYVRFLFINDSDKNVFKRPVKHLFPFDNSVQNLKFKESGEKSAHRGFKEAYELVIKYLLRKKRYNNLNARRFLTLHNENDQVEQARACLFRLTGSFDSCSSVSDENRDEEDNIGYDDSCVDESLVDEEVEERSTSVQQSSEKKARIAEILKDLETVPNDMTVSPEEYEKMKTEASQLLGIIRSRNCFNHLMRIRRGRTRSCLHSKFYNEERVHGGLGPFTLFPELTCELLSIMDNHCDEHDTPNYKQSVMLPEAIIYAISKLKKCNRIVSKRHFRDMCTKVGVQE